MSRYQFARCAALSALSVCFCLGSLSVAAEHGMSKGSPDIQHAGPLAFGPDGVLFVGDTRGAAIYAIDTGDRGQASSKSQINVAGVNGKIAAMVGSTPQETVINDIAVNPASGNVYLSIARGLGPDSQPGLFKADAKGNVSEVALKDINFSKVAFDDAPASKEGGRNPRLSTITDLQFEDGKLIVAGLSNEEFASKLRVLNFPFDGKKTSTSIEVYHGAHGKLETASPVRTFITYENTVLAAYTCTPLVTIPVDDLKGQKVTGKTIAELGNRNNPLDMVIYKKGDQDYLLMANTARGVMKIKLDKGEFDAAKSINSRIDGTAGVPYETLPYENVAQLDKLDDGHAIMLVVQASGSADLKSIALP